MKKILLLILFSLFLIVALKAQNQADSTQKKLKLEAKLGEGKISVNAYADFGYVWGPQGEHRFYNYVTGDSTMELGRRDFTSYPLYANQFSLSYGYLQAQYEIKNKVRLRFAMHAGHIPDALYFEEHPSLKYVREASIYYYLSPKLAIEGGIFPSYFGAEVPLNKENLHATRGYIADFAPDYEAGFRVHYLFNQYMTFSAMILSGWQEIRDGNGKKGYAFSWNINKPNKIVGSWNIYFGDESDLGAKFTLYRLYHNIYYRIWVGKKFLILPALDWVMEQKTANQDGYNYVVAPAFSLRYAINDNYGVAFRYDKVYNPNDIVEELRTYSPNGWRSDSFTLTFEYLPLPQLTFRAEGRYGFNKDAVFRDSQNKPTRIDTYAIVSASFHF